MNSLPLVSLLDLIISAPCPCATVLRVRPGHVLHILAGLEATQRTSACGSTAELAVPVLTTLTTPFKGCRLSTSTLFNLILAIFFSRTYRGKLLHKLWSTHPSLHQLWVIQRDERLLLHLLTSSMGKMCATTGSQITSVAQIQLSLSPAVACGSEG